MSRPKVEIIPAKKPHLSAQISAPMTRRLTAAYARVSTDSEEQKNSYEAQVSFYTETIQARPEWQFVSVYTDEYPPYRQIPNAKNKGVNRFPFTPLLVFQCF